MSEYTAEAAEEILKKLNDKGWNLYKAEYSCDNLDPDATVRGGPVLKLEQDLFYVILPEVENAADPFAVSDALKEVMKKTGGSIQLAHGEKGISLQAIILREQDIGVGDPESKIAAGVVYPTFIDLLERLYDRNLDRQINYANIDSSIRIMVQEMNKIPFVRTLKSRAGRLDDMLLRDIQGEEPFSKEEWALPPEEKKIAAKPEDGNIMITKGYVNFTVRAHPQARDFLLDLKELASKYSFAVLDCVDKKWSFTLDCNDLTHEHEVEENDDYTVRNKKQHEADEEKAKKRITKFQEIRDKVMKIVEKYVWKH